jgi:tetratricopeptide (TPR) repeat protein
MNKHTLKNLLLTTILFFSYFFSFSQTAKQYYEQGNKKYLNFDIEGALTDINKAIALNPNMAEAYLKKGLIASMFLFQDKLGLECLNKSIQINTNFDTAYYMRGVVKSSINDTTGAIEDFEKVIKLNPKYKGAHKLLGAELTKKKYLYLEIAIEEYNKEIENIDKQNMGVDEYLELANLYSAIGVAEFKRIKYNRESLDAALLNFKISTILNPNIFDNYFYTGRIKLLQNNYHEAIDNFYEASGIDDENSDAYFYKGLSLVEIGEDSFAINCFKHCLKLDSTNILAFKNCASTYYDIKYYRCAILYYSNAIKLNNLDHESYYLRAKAKGKINDYKGAIEDYTKAIEIKSNDYDSYIKRARANFKLNNYLNGILDWIKYIYYSIVS